MQSFNQRLKQRIAATDSNLCVGLDIAPEQLPTANPTLKDLEKHAVKIVDATRGLAAAYKPNLAFFERWGADGLRWLERLLKHIGPEAVTIGDAKRGDIGNTARQYAASLFDHFGFDAVTVNPYMGGDAIKPFIEKPEHGVFVLCRTSNPSAEELQSLVVDGTPVYLKTADLANGLNQLNNVGLVVGATAPEELQTICRRASQLPLLIPGVGAQGGDLAAVIKAGQAGGPLLINVSRGISLAGDMSGAAIRDAAENYVKQMRKIRAELKT